MWWLFVSLFSSVSCCDVCSFEPNLVNSVAFWFTRYDMLQHQTAAAMSNIQFEIHCLQTTSRLLSTVIGVFSSTDRFCHIGPDVLLFAVIFNVRSTFLDVLIKTIKCTAISESLCMHTVRKKSLCSFQKCSCVILQVHLGMNPEEHSFDEHSLQCGSPILLLRHCSPGMNHVRFHSSFVGDTHDENVWTRLRVPLTWTNSGTFCSPSLFFFCSSSIWRKKKTYVVSMLLRTDQFYRAEKSKALLYVLGPDAAVCAHYSQLVVSAASDVVSPPDQWKRQGEAPSAFVSPSTSDPGRIAAQAFFWATDPWGHGLTYDSVDECRMWDFIDVLSISISVVFF